MFRSFNVFKSWYFLSTTNSHRYIDIHSIRCSNFKLLAQKLQKPKLSLEVIQVVPIFIELYVYLFVLCKHYSYYQLLLIAVGSIVTSISFFLFFFEQPVGFSLQSCFSCVNCNQQLIWLASTNYNKYSDNASSFWRNLK